MPFNTQNPIPSGDLRDLDDNARNIDTWANDKTKLSHPDRFGVSRRTWHGIEQEAKLNIQQAIDAKNAAQEAVMMSGFSKYADTLAQLEAGIGTDYLEGDVVMVFQDESRGDTSSIFKIESGAAEFKLTFDKTRQDLLSFTGNISADAKWSDVPAHSDPAFDVQAQALANRVEWVATTMQKKFQEWVSVKDYGAVGDGVTDDTAAIQNALDNGSLIFFPPGVYRVSQVGISSGTSILGVQGKSIIRGLPSTNLSPVTNKNPASISRISVSGMVFDAFAGDQPSNATTSAAYFINITDSSFTRCEFTGGLRRIHASGGSGFGEGLDLRNPRMVTVSDCYAHDNDYDGIKIRAGEHCTIQGNICERNGAGGIQLSNPPTSEVNRATRFCTVVGNTVVAADGPSSTSTWTRGITLHYAQFCVVQGNTLTGQETRSPESTGIKVLEESSYNVITGNVIRRFHRGIWIGGIQGDVCTYNKISENSITGCYLGVSADTWARFTTISGNKLFSIDTWGIALNSGQNRQEVLSNVIDSAVIGGITINNNQNAKVFGNRVNGKLAQPRNVHMLETKSITGSSLHHVSLLSGTTAYPGIIEVTNSSDATFTIPAGRYFVSYMMEFEGSSAEFNWLEVQGTFNGTMIHRNRSIAASSASLVRAVVSGELYINAINDSPSSLLFRVLFPGNSTLTFRDTSRISIEQVG